MEEQSDFISEIGELDKLRKRDASKRNALVKEAQLVDIGHDEHLQMRQDLKESLDMVERLTRPSKATTDQAWTQSFIGRGPHLKRVLKGSRAKASRIDGQHREETLYQEQLAKPHLGVDEPFRKQLRTTMVLTNHHQLAVQKLSCAQIDIRRLRAQMLDGSDDKRALQGTVDELRSKLDCKKQDIRRCIEAIHECERAKHVGAKRLETLERKAKQDHEERERRRLDVLETNSGAVDTMANRHTEEESDALARKRRRLEFFLIKGAWAVAKFKADIIVTNKRLDKASKLLERVQSGTGLHDPDELLASFQSAGEKFFLAYRELCELQAEAEEERKRQNSQERRSDEFPLAIVVVGESSRRHARQRREDVHAELIQELHESERQSALVEQMLEGRRTQTHQLVDRVQQLINELCERPILVTESNLVSEALTHVELIVLGILSRRSSAPQIQSMPNPPGTFIPQSLQS